MTQLDSTVVSVSLSTIQQELHSSVEVAQWIISGYLLALALMLPLNDWIVDRIGAKRLYLACFTTFTLASALCGSARTIDHLILARLVQGIAGGLLAPLTQMMIARVAGRNMARVIGYAAVPILLAPILGPVIAGGVLKYASWPWLFFLNLPVGILAVGLAVFLLPNDDATIQRRQFDFLGFLLISPGLVCLLYGFEHVSDRSGFSALILGFMLIGGFVWDALRKKSTALIDLRLFGNGIFSTATATQFLLNGVAFAGQMLVPLYLIAGCGFSAAKAGWILAPMGLGMLCAYPMMGFLTDRFGCRAVSVGGVLLTSLGTLPLLWMVLHEFSPSLMVLSMLARGSGQGATGIPSISAAYASVPKEKLGLATTAMNIVQRLGGPIATTGLAVVMSASTTLHQVPTPRMYLIPFLALLGLQLLVLISASRLPERIHESVEEGHQT
ncbi:DHA2 family efflux MFS transporter permease subunit [Bradyrhizobium sp. Pear77]|nr:DHA2 family efflux MFS transporter permease subunit [Bradyrhizobium altum]